MHGADVWTTYALAHSNVNGPVDIPQEIGPYPGSQSQNRRSLKRWNMPAISISIIVGDVSRSRHRRQTSRNGSQMLLSSSNGCYFHLCSARRHWRRIWRSKKNESHHNVQRGKPADAKHKFSHVNHHSYQSGFFISTSWICSKPLQFVIPDDWPSMAVAMGLVEHSVFLSRVVAITVGLRTGSHKYAGGKTPLGCWRVSGLSVRLIGDAERDLRNLSPLTVRWCRLTATTSHGCSVGAAEPGRNHTLLF